MPYSSSQIPFAIFASFYQKGLGIQHVVGTANGLNHCCVAFGWNLANFFHLVAVLILRLFTITLTCPTHAHHKADEKC